MPLEFRVLAAIWSRGFDLLASRWPVLMKLWSVDKFGCVCNRVPSRRLARVCVKIAGAAQVISPTISANPFVKRRRFGQNNLTMTIIKTTIQGRRLVLDVPADWPDGTEVEVWPVNAGIPTDRASWLQFIERTAGSITDPTFERHPQGELEERESLP